MATIGLGSPDIACCDPEPPRWLMRCVLVVLIFAIVVGFVVLTPFMLFDHWVRGKA